MPLAPDRFASLASSFRRFAEAEAAGYSPLYEQLALGVAEDPELLAIAAGAPSGQPAPNLLFGAVHYLLLASAEHPLRQFYPSLWAPGHQSWAEQAPGKEKRGSDRPEPVEGRPWLPAEGPFPAFRDFCLAHTDEIAGLLVTRRVQTNEVGRSACLMPAFNHVASLSSPPLALIEIGASAGLNLTFDRHFYDYGDLGTAGDPSSTVRLRCEVRGGNRPPVEALPAVAFRAGCDINVVDVAVPDQRLWLRALVWPEHAERAAVLEAAMDTVQADPPLLLEGDGVELLPALVEMCPPDLTVCVFHSMVMNQVPDGGRARIYDTLREYSWQRPVFEVSMLGTQGGRWAEIELARSVRGEWRRALLARCHPHGLWLEWLVT